MGHSQAEKAESRERILSIAARQIREGGIDSVSIGQVMKAARLTHGGFYGHFASREALIAAALDRAMDSSAGRYSTGRESRPTTPAAIAARYLTPAHRDNLSGGCALAALAGDVGRTDDDIRQSMAQRIERAFDGMTAAFGEGAAAREAAVVSWCAMIGALTLSRVLKGSPASDEVLRHVSSAISALEASGKSMDKPGDP